MRRNRLCSKERTDGNHRKSNKRRFYEWKQQQEGISLYAVCLGVESKITVQLVTGTNERIRTQRKCNNNDEIKSKETNISLQLWTCRYMLSDSQRNSISRSRHVRAVSCSVRNVFVFYLRNFYYFENAKLYLVSFVEFHWICDGWCVSKQQQTTPSATVCMKCLMSFSQFVFSPAIKPTMCLGMCACFQYTFHGENQLRIVYSNFTLHLQVKNRYSPR